MSSLPNVDAPYQGDPLADFPQLKGSINSDRDDTSLPVLGIFFLLFILQTVIFVVIVYGLQIGFFDEKFFRSKTKIPFFKHLFQEIEQEYEKPAPPEVDKTTD